MNVVAFSDDSQISSDNKPSIFTGCKHLLALIDLLGLAALSFLGDMKKNVAKKKKK
jgi:hypothetical protein